MSPHETNKAVNSNNMQQRAYSVMSSNQSLEEHHKRHEQLQWHEKMYKKYGYTPKTNNPLYFGHYLLLQTLGEGEFAKVKAGIHCQTDQEVAIKLIKLDQIKDASLKTKLDREISVLRSVEHPYIVKLYEVFRIKNYMGIVLQRAAGGELFEYILKHHCLQETEAKRLFAQLISGVNYMHQKKIVHRDLKLENLLLTKDRNIIIIDFGFANRFDIAKKDLMATSCGSPCYAAPELVVSDDENNQYVGTAVDIWSCGVILFAMLCGYLPFDDDPLNPDSANINMLYKHIMSTKLEIPKHISKEATHLLESMLVPDPKDRCTIDHIIHHPWLKDHFDLLNQSIEQLETQCHENYLAESSMVLGEEKASTTTNRRNTASLIISPQPPPSPSQPLPLPANLRDKETQTPPFLLPPQPHSAPPQQSSFLHSKFISTLQRHVSSNSAPPPPSMKSPTNMLFPRSPSAHQPMTQRERTVSTNSSADSKRMHHLSLNILPSVSEQTIASPSIDTRRSNRQRIMDFFRRKGSSQSTRFPTEPQYSNTIYDHLVETRYRPTVASSNSRPVSVPASNPIRALSIGKHSVASSATTNTVDSRIRLHKGTLDKDALTSENPHQVFTAVRKSLESMGITIKTTDRYKLECTRPSMHHRTRKISTAVPLKRLFSSSHNNSHNGKKKLSSVTATLPIYGEQSVDTGEKIQFTVELCKLDNLPGLYVVDIKRTRGNIWAFKFLYHTLLDLLNLSADPNSNQLLLQESNGMEPQQQDSYLLTDENSSRNNRTSYMTSGSSSNNSRSSASSMRVFEDALAVK